MAQQKKEVRLQHIVPESLEPKTCNQFAIVTTPNNETHVFLGYVRPPILVGDQSAIEEQIAKIDHVDAVYFGDVVFSPGRFVEFAKAVADHLAQNYGNKTS